MALKASPSEQALLLDLQTFDTKLAQIAHRAKSLTQHAGLQKLAADRAAIAVTWSEQRGTLEDAQTELGRIESDVAVVEARIKRDDARLQGTSSVKDVQALEQELTALRKRQGDLEEIELVVMERVEELSTTLALTQSKIDAVETLVADAESERDAELVVVEAERANAAANRAAIAEKIPADLLALYEKLRARYGQGVSFLRGGVSSASGVKLNENDMVAIRAAAPDDVLLCPDSNVILVRTNQSGI
jgi:predicted  nucleic acid-binding Zn-ribbon protein